MYRNLCNNLHKTKKSFKLKSINYLGGKISYCEHPKCAKSRIKPLKKVHNYLCAKSSKYHNWHHHPHHRRVHYGVLSIILVVSLAVGASILPNKVKAVATFFAGWDNGLSSFGADSALGSTSASNNGTTIVEPGFGGTGGALNVQPRQTLRFNTKNNIDLSRSLIESNFRLDYPLSGIDTSELKFNNPGQIALDNSVEGSTIVYVADTANNRIVRMNWNGSDWDSWYSYGTQGSAVGQFSAPSSIYFDSSRQIAYIGDSRNCRIVRLHWNGEGWDSWRDYGYCGLDQEQFNTSWTNFSAFAFDDETQTLMLSDPGRIIRITWDDGANDWADWHELLAGNNDSNINFTIVGGMVWNSTNSYLYFVANTAGVEVDPNPDYSGDEYFGDAISVFGTHWSGDEWESWWNESYNYSQYSFAEVASTTGLAQDTLNHYIYLSNTDNTLYRYDISANNGLPEPTQYTDFGEGTDPIVSILKGIVFDETNKILYAIDLNNSSPLIRAHQIGDIWNQYSKSAEAGSATPSFAPSDVAFDPNSSTLFVKDTGGSNARIVAMHITNNMVDKWYSYGKKGGGEGGFGGVINGVSYGSMYDIVFDPVNSALYIALIDYTNNSKIKIIRLHWDGSEFDSWYDFTVDDSQSAWDFGGIDFDSVNQGLYFTLPYRYDPNLSTGVYSTLFRLQWDNENTQFSSIVQSFGIEEGENCHLYEDVIGRCNFAFGYGTGNIAVDPLTGMIYITNGSASLAPYGQEYISDFYLTRIHWDNDLGIFDTLYTFPNSITSASDLAFDSNNKVLYLVDTAQYHVVRMAWNEGNENFDQPITYGMAGNIQDYAGSGGRSREGQFALPVAIAFDPTTGNIYIADTNNSRVAKIVWSGEDSFTNWGTYTDPYHYLMSTSAQYPLRIRLNMMTSRLEFFLAAGNKEIYMQTDPLTLSASTWYKFQVRYDSTNGRLLIGIYDAVGDTVNEKTATATPWAAPTSLGGNFYIGSDKIANYDQRAIGGSIDNFKIESLAPPPTPVSLSVSPVAYTGDRHFEFSWSPGEGDGLGNIESYEYNINNTGWIDNGTNTTYTFDDPDNEDERLIEGKNIFKLRAKGKFDNYSSEIGINFYYSNAVATAPFITTAQDTSADSPSITNNFTINWLPPNENPPEGSEQPVGVTGGDPSKIIYHYSVDVRPVSTDSPTKTTSPGAVSVGGVKATKQSPQPSVFYILSQGENGLVSWEACGSSTVPGEENDPTKVRDDSRCGVFVMYVQTPSPGIPTSLIAKDTSNKDLQIFEAVLRWYAPTYVGAGIAGYEVCRSTSAEVFDVCADTAETYFYQTGLQSIKYYYRIRAFDAAHSYSDYSDAVEITPTGDFKFPPVLKENSLSTNVRSSSATIKWTTQDAELKNVHKASSYVEYGFDPDHVGKANGGFEQGSKELVDDHEVRLTGLQPDNTKYYYRLVWSDVNGNTGTYQQFDESKPFATVFNTGVRPTVNNLSISNITLNSAIIAYETSVSSTTEISYGLDKNDLSNTCLLSSNGYSTNHIVNLPCPKAFSSTSESAPLNHSSTYYFKIKGHDVDDELLDIGVIYDFKTLIMPKIEGGVKMEQDTEAPTTTYKFSWRTNVKTSSEIFYVDNKNKQQSKTSPDLTLDHEITVPSLADQSIYTFTITGTDENWNKVENPYINAVSTPKDSRPPKIFNLTVEVKSTGFGATQKAQLVVTWETDEPSSSQIEYEEGISGTEYKNKSKEDLAYSTSHAVILAELEPSKIYHLRAVSKDEAGNAGYSEDTTTITGKTQQSIIDIIVGSLQRSLGWLFKIFKQ